ncbi:MAG TPA: hypothetical protein VFX67_02820 [Burkholderiales bacterium]|nr:hypothetical protein [Burkholderiales bacterium]
MRWLAALCAGSCVAIALFAAFYGYKSFEDWQSARTELSARIAALETDSRNPNREGNLKSAHHLLDLANGVVLEKAGASALVLILALAAFGASYRYAARFLTRFRLFATAAAGALIPVAVGIVVLLMLGAGAIRG